jgi:eukaryotic-like serine/threonine-protein kinase
MALELQVVAGSTPRSITAPSTQFVVGSAADCEVRFSSEAVHERHAEFAQNETGKWVVRALSTQAVVLVNWVETNQATLNVGDKLCLGGIEFEVLDDDEADISTAIRPRPKIESASLSSGTIIGQRYRLFERVATGGMGEVYRAEHIELEQPLAIKVMRREFSNDVEFAQRFKREATSSTRIGHEHIVSVIDFGRTEDGRLFSVMEFLTGETLSAAILANGPLPEARVRHIAAQTADALAAAHAHGVIHRDLKPDNIMLLQRPGRPDFVKVLDFGVAKISSAATLSGETSAGFIVGTPQYMSPEQSAGLNVDARTDVYSLGLILYELLNGRPAFRGETPSIVMALQMMEPPPPFEALSVSADLKSLVLRMLAKRPEGRPPSMVHVKAELLDESHPTIPVASMRAPQLVRPAVNDAPLSQSTPQRRLLVPSDAGGSDESTVSEVHPPPTDSVEALRAIAPRRWPWLLALLLMAAAAAALWQWSPWTAELPVLREVNAETQPEKTATTTAPTPEAVPTPTREREPPAGATLSADASVELEVREVEPKDATAAEPTPLAEIGKEKTPSEKKPSPARAPEVEQIIVRVVTRPPGALVQFRKKDLGRTPLSLNRPQGTRLPLTLTLKGHVSQRVELRFSADKTVDYELSPLPTKEVTPRKGPQPREGTPKDLHDNPFETPETP